MHGYQSINRLDLQHQSSVYEQINPKRIRDADAIKINRNRLLAFNEESLALQLLAQDYFICRFKKARAKPLMQTHTAINRGTCQLLNIVHRFPPPPSCLRAFV